MNSLKALLASAFLLIITIFGPFIDNDGSAATGDILSSFIPGPTGNGRAVAFDGDILYYTFFGDTNIYMVDTDGVSLGAIPNPGRTFTCGALSWDQTRNVLWCGSYDGSTVVYTINPNTGVASQQFDASAFGGIAQDSCYGPGEEAFIDGLAYDASDNTLWLSGDAAQTIYHLQTDGTLIASYTVPNHPTTGTTGCNTGITVVDDHLELALQAGPDLGPHYIVRVAKSNPTGPRIASFVSSAVDNPGIEDLEFDSTTFAPECAVWSNQFGLDVILTAWEVQCPPLSLSFPLKGSMPGTDENLTPYTATINSFFDHSQISPYTDDNRVVAYTGERGDFVKNDPIQDCRSRATKKLFGFKNEQGAPFVMNPNYSGGGTTCPIKKSGKITCDPSCNTFLFYDGHPGIDYRASGGINCPKGKDGLGTEVYAVVDGTVRYPKRIPGLTNASIFTTLELNPDTHPEYMIYYLHLSTHPSLKNEIKQEGAHVKRGDLIGRTGCGGNVDPHLHFEVQKNGIPVDPYGWQGAGSDPYSRETNIMLWE